MEAEIYFIHDFLHRCIGGVCDNTVPDYYGIKYSEDVNGKRSAEVFSQYDLESFFELKATKNDVGLGSFEGQLKVQIQAARNRKVRQLIIATTYGVKLTKNLINYGAENGVRVVHYWAHYKMVLNKMKISFTPAKD